MSRWLRWPFVVASEIHPLFISLASYQLKPGGIQRHLTLQEEIKGTALEILGRQD